MSRILRRPMFRGGAVDSRGTGITSGLMDTPKRGLVDGPGGYAGDLFSILKGTNTRGYGGNNMILGGELYPQSNTTTDILSMKDYLSTNRNILDQKKEVPVGSEGDVILKTTEDLFIEKKAKDDADEAKAKEMGVTVDQMKAIEAENLTAGAIKDSEFEKSILNQKDLSPTGNEPSNTVIDEKDLIRQQAELFKELLGEDKDKRIKDARISDASDYLLKFFEGSQQEGATVGSSAANVASFAAGRPSMTDKAKAANEKVDQTATVLAINDYIAGKRSKEDIKKALSLAAATTQMKKGDVAGAVADYAKRNGQPPPVSVLKTFIRDDSRLDGKSIEEFDSTATKVEYSPGDENKVFIDTVTKEVFTFNKGNPNRISISG